MSKLYLHTTFLNQKCFPMTKKSIKACKYTFKTKIRKNCYRRRTNWGKEASIMCLSECIAIRTINSLLNWAPLHNLGARTVKTPHSVFNSKRHFWWSKKKCNWIQNWKVPQVSQIYRASYRQYYFNVYHYPAKECEWKSLLAKSDTFASYWQ